MLSYIFQASRQCDEISFFIKDKRFKELEAMEIAKHNVFHLVNLIAKMTKVIDSSWIGEVSSPSMIVDEVIPDLVVYFIQYSRAFEIDVENNFSYLSKSNAGWEKTRESLTALSKAQEEWDKENFKVAGKSYAEMSIEEILGYCRCDIILVTCEITKYCDRIEHNDSPLSERLKAMIPRLLIASMRISCVYDIDIDSIYSNRISFILNKY